MFIDQNLPSLSKMLLPAMATITRGVKVKPGGILIQRHFQDVSPDLKGIADFLRFMEISNPEPLTYLYILAQRTQAAVMLDKSFTIAIPGLIHLENSIEQTGDFKLRERFDMRIEVVVDYKSEGSVIARFTVVFFQGGIKVAVCKSTYLARRKTRSGTKNHKSPYSIEPVKDVILDETWILDRQIGLKYARVSGDKNPIHTHQLAARLAGFPRPLMHGWYGVSRIVQRTESLQKRTFQKIVVTFKSPVFLPGSQNFELSAGAENALDFTLYDLKTGVVNLLGHLS